MKAVDAADALRETIATLEALGERTHYGVAVVIPPEGEALSIVLTGSAQGDREFYDYLVRRLGAEQQRGGAMIGFPQRG